MLPSPECRLADDGPATAPFLFSMDELASHLELHAYAPGSPAEIHKVATARSPADSLVEVKWRLAHNEALRTAVSDLGSWSAFRLSKWYETVDSLTADVAYRHCGETIDGTRKGLALVTAGHYFSRKLAPTNLSRDLIIGL